MRNVVRANLLDPPFVLAKKRALYLKRWTARAKELAVAEEQLREQMPEHVRGVVGQKRLVLLGEMLSDLGYPDDKLVSDIAAGFRLSGYMTRSNVFRAKSKRPPMSMEDTQEVGQIVQLKEFCVIEQAPRDGA